MRRIYVKEDVCIGCRLCEIYCIVQHSKSKNIIKAFRDEPRPLPGVIVEEKGPISFALQCRHCDDAPCVESCITGAMQRMEDGRIICDIDRCVGCWTCIMVCPYGAIRMDQNRKVASKCDLCIGEDIPVCVKNCPNEALMYEE